MIPFFLRFDLLFRVFRKLSTSISRVSHFFDLLLFKEFIVPLYLLNLVSDPLPLRIDLFRLLVIVFKHLLIVLLVLVLLFEEVFNIS